MRQLGLLAASFGGTLAVLLLVYLALGGLGGSSPVATPSHTPEPTPDFVASAPPTIHPRPTIRPTATPSPGPSGTPASGTPSGGPGATPKASPTPGPSLAPGSTLTITVKGRDYSNADIPSNGSVTKQGDAVILKTTRDQSAFLVVEWTVPPGALPPGAKIARIDTLVCGSGKGDFWETYGPDGSDPYEYAVEEPAADGCWHFTNAPGPDTIVIASTRTEATMRVDRIVYTITLR